MAVAWADVPASERTDRAADLPMMGSQVIPVSPAYAKWVDEGQVGAGDITSWTDRGATATPTRWTYDGYGHRKSTVSGATDDVWYLFFDLGAEYTMDYAAIINHDFDTDGIDAVTMLIATGNDFGLPGGSPNSLYSVGTFSLRGSDKRLLLADFDHAGDGDPQRYTGVQYCGIKIDHSVTTGDIVPQLGEIFIGRTYQLSHKPAVPWDDVAMSENVDWADTESGIVDQEVYHRRRFDLSATLSEHEDDHIADLKAWYRATRGPFVWVYEPNSNLALWHFMMRRGGMRFPAQGFVERETVIEAVEQGPEDLYLDVEENG